MHDEKTPNRRYPLTARDHAGVVDADRIAESFTLIDADVTELLREATEKALGRVLLSTAKKLAEGDPNSVPTAEQVKGYVATEIADLIGSTPGALDTLAALAEALGNDPNFAVTITELIGTKADKDATAKSLDAKADKTALDAGLNERYTKGDVDTRLQKKADQSSLEQVSGNLNSWIGGVETAHNAALTNLYQVKADVTWATNEFSNRYTKAESDGRFARSGKDATNGIVKSQFFFFPDHSNPGDVRQLIVHNGYLKFRAGDNSELVNLGADGNIWSSVWEGGHLHHHIAVTSDSKRQAAQDWAYASLVQDVRLAGWWELGRTMGAWVHAPAGGVVTAWFTRTVGTAAVIDVMGGHHIQFLRAGNWYTVGVW